MFRDFNDKTQRQNLPLSDQIDINHTLILTKISSQLSFHSKEISQKEIIKQNVCKYPHPFSSLTLSAKTNPVALL